MKKLLVLIAFVFVSGCIPVQSENTQHTVTGASVEKLFTVDGCSVYRFSDAGRRVYFTNCRGNTQWKETCGKNCYRDVIVSGGDT